MLVSFVWSGLVSRGLVLHLSITRQALDLSSGESRLVLSALVWFSLFVVLFFLHLNIIRHAFDLSVGEFWSGLVWSGLVWSFVVLFYTPVSPGMLSVLALVSHLLS